MKGIMALELDIQEATEHAGDIPSRQAMETWVGAALEGRREAAQLVIRIVDEQESSELNESYRRRNGPTNVLSFPFERPELLDPPLLGDIVICAPLVAREAADQGKTRDAHWAHLLIHGVLHLTGHDHEEERDALVMERLERTLLASLGYPDPYEEAPLDVSPATARRHEASQ